MKAGIHPEYGKSVVSCSCGETFETRSTKKNNQGGSVFQMPPFYTGQRQSLSSTGGRVERFLTRYNLKEKAEEGKKIGLSYAKAGASLLFFIGGILHGCFF